MKKRIHLETEPGLRMRQPGQLAVHAVAQHSQDDEPRSGIKISSDALDDRKQAAEQIEHREQARHVSFVKRHE
jgi:hypothetical protein